MLEDSLRQTDPVLLASRYIQNRADATARYASWDHCFNHFRGIFDEGRASQFLEDEALLETSSLQLGFYLASWGMYRGKAQLLQHSSSVLAPVVRAISTVDASVWALDVEAYDNESIALLLEVAQVLRGHLPGKPTDTLVTKVMLGVFGNIPAFDRYFRAGLGVSGLNRKALLKVAEYFGHHRAAVESLRIPTLGFAGKPTDLTYTQAKIIDMIFYIAGGGR